MMTKVTLELPELPEGYEYTGEYRPVADEEYYLDRNNDVARGVYDASRWPVPVVRQIKWRALEGDPYWCVGQDTLCPEHSVDRYTVTDTCHWEVSNYFKTKEEARVVAAKWKEVLASVQ